MNRFKLEGYSLVDGNYVKGKMRSRYLNIKEISQKHSEIQKLDDEIRKECAKRGLHNKKREQYIVKSPDVTKIINLIASYELRIKKLKLGISLCKASLKSNIGNLGKEYDSKFGKFDSTKITQLKRKRQNLLRKC